MWGAEMTHRPLAALLSLLLLSACPGPEDDTSVDPPDDPAWTAPTTCAGCHPSHFEEWQGSVMHYAAASPTFNAFELVMRRATEGQVAPNGANPNFCTGCHAPTSAIDGDLPDYTGPDDAVAAIDHFSKPSRQGVSCDVCHSITGPDHAASTEGDGIGNASFLLEPSHTKYGPITDPIPSPYHQTQPDEYLSTSEFCGACHDVRLPAPDVVTGEPFQRLENLFTEWKEGPWNSVDNPTGDVVTCQDCHMSLYPDEPPGTYPVTRVSVLLDSPPRKHALHSFTAVSTPLVASEQPYPDYEDVVLPNISTSEVDAFGVPLGQQERRERMLRAACTLTLEGTPTSVSPDSEVIPVRVTVENVGAGHRVPSGFSQEREVWVELTVADDAGVIYQSGHLVDSAHPETGEATPDGRLNDEDLLNGHFTLDTTTLVSEWHPGDDRNQRPQKNLGLVNFQNHFVRVTAEGRHEKVMTPLETHHMDNSHSLDMFVPRTFKFDVPMPDRPLSGEVRVSAKLRYRSFPPHFLRMLAEQVPELVSEEMVDRNTVVDMAEHSAVITVNTP